MDELPSSGGLGASVGQVTRDARADDEPRPPTPEPEGVGAPLSLADVGDLRLARAEVRRALAAGTLSQQAVEGFLVAFSEVATNALVHGEAPVRVRLWVTGPSVVCEVTDGGRGFDCPRPGRREPEELAHDGRGLWIARQFCDSLVAAPGPGGFTVTLRLGR